MSLIIQDHDQALIFSEGEGAYPRECCGFLLGSRQGSRSVVQRVIPAENKHESPDRYRISPETYLVVDRIARQEEQAVIGFYHSHPDGLPRPSETDRRQAIPGCAYIIVTVKDGKAGNLTAWSLSKDGTRFGHEPLG